MGILFRRGALTGLVFTTAYILAELRRVTWASGRYVNYEGATNTKARIDSPGAGLTL